MLKQTGHLKSGKLVLNEKMPAMGGTEILLSGLQKYTNIAEHEDINIILSNPDKNKLKYSKKNVVWQHLNHEDESLSNLKDKGFTSFIDSFVYVSNWQYEKFRYFYNISLENSYIIKNAIEPIELIKKPKDGKIKLIYTSTPFRGLEILLESFALLNRDDVELDVYSSTLVYGSGYAEHVGDVYEPLFEKARNMKNVNYKGYAPNKEIHKALQEAHIFAYPSIFQETCCLAMVEAGAAGCRLISTSLGALYETGSEYAVLMPLKQTFPEMVKDYAKLLNDEIDSYWSTLNQEKLKEQSDFFNKYYSWELRSKEWNNLFDKISST